MTVFSRLKHAYVIIMAAQAGITGARWRMACKTGITLDVSKATAEIDYLVIVISRHKIRF